MAEHAPFDQTVIVMFDGDCSVCNGYVRRLAGLDKHRHLRFASSQSPVGQRLTRWMADHSGTEAFRETLVEETVVAIKVGDKSWSTRSDAILDMIAALPTVYRPLQLGRFLPRRLRDAQYNRVSTNRYKFHEGVCAVPAKEVREAVEQRTLSEADLTGLDLH